MQAQSASDRVRRGLCLLNAGLFDEAIAKLSEAAGTLRDAGAHSCADADRSHADTLRMYLESLPFQTTGPHKDDGAISALRHKIANDPENPELHFQLGAQLVYAGRFEEAELRFTQVLSVDRAHVDALICLALCHQQRDELGLALTLFQRAQALRPSDPHVTLLLAKVVKLCHDRGQSVDLCAAVTND